MNNKAKSFYSWSFVLFAVIFAITLIYFASAGHVITNPAGATTFFVQEGVSTMYNFTVNTTDANANGNISEVNITIPTAFTFTTGINGTDAVNPIYNDTATLKSWQNASGLVLTAALQRFWFNATCTQPGIYNISVLTSNSTTRINTNFSVTVDSTAPVITLISPVNNNITVSPVNIPFVFTTSDSTPTNCSLILNGAIIAVNSSVNRSGGATIFMNTSYGITNRWSVNCTDHANNKGNSSTWTYSIPYVQINGTAKDEDGNPLNNANVNISIINMEGWSTATKYSTTANASGWFNLTAWSQSGFAHQLSINHLNVSTNFVDFVSKNLPAMGVSAQGAQIQQVAGTTFYLTPAGTITIAVINSSADKQVFQYEIKDTKLGYPIASDHSAYTTEVTAYVPRNRNYSIMVYPNSSMPVSFNWNNFSSSTTYNSSGVAYNTSSKQLIKHFNLTMTMAWVTGYANVTGLNWTNYTIIPYLLEPGNMVHSQYGAMPYNQSGNGQVLSDTFNLASGFFNISLPATTESTTIILFASARGNDTYYYGGFRNISLSYPTTSAAINFTNVSRLLGSETNITIDRMDNGGQKIAIPTAKKTFYFVNASNTTIGNASAHIETTVDYSRYGAIEFTWMTEIAQSDTVSYYSLPLLNSPVKEINAFLSGGGGGSSSYSPRRISLNGQQVNTETNITMRSFNPESIDGAVGSGRIYIELFISNSSCDVPSPPTDCSLGGPKNMNMSDPSAGFNPMKAVFGGGKISFRMGSNSSGILIHYVNVDMLASGPPDALFENDAGTSESSSAFSNAVKFGSQGPSIYDYILISMPYTEGSSSVTGLNENADVNISIPTYYDDNWNPVWSTASNGTSMEAFAGNYSHYSAYKSEWGNLTLGKNCSSTAITSSANLNSTNFCYINKSNNRIWVRIPHFSGTGTTIGGTLITASSSSSDSSGGGGGGSAADAADVSYASRFASITAGLPAVVTPSAELITATGLKEVSVTTNVNLVDVDFTLSTYKEADVESKLAGTYKYFSITAPQMSESYITSAEIKFEVAKSWFTDNDYDVSKVKLMRYKSGEWQSLETIATGESAGAYQFKAKSPGFSIFAVVSEKKTVISNENVTIPPTEGTTTPTGGAAGTSKLLLKWLLLGVLIAALIAIIAYLITPKGHDRFLPKKKHLTERKKANEPATKA